MRIKLCFWLLLALVPFNVFGKQKLRTETDAIKTLIGITRIENIKGQRLSAVKGILDDYGIPIKCLLVEGTSPFVNPKGKSYVHRVVIGYLTLDEMNARIGTTKRRGMVLDIILEGPYDKDIEEFDKKYHLDVFDKEYNPERAFEQIKNMFTIKKIDCWYLDY